MDVNADPAAGAPGAFDPPFARRRERADRQGRTSNISDEERAGIVRRLRWLSRLLDDAIPIPGTRFAIGLDPIIGLAPGVGDAVSMLISAYIIIQGRRLGASNRTLALMIVNVLLDALSGTIPLVGDVVDAAFKANQRNLRLLGITPAMPGDPL